MTVEASADPGSPWYSHRVALEVAGLVLVTIGVCGTYWWTSAPRFNPGTSIDPWLYTALFVNFDFTYSHFVLTYYATRLPWIIPGYLLNLVFSPVTAYYILHVAFFFGGGLFAYFLVRRFVGQRAALFAYAGLLGSQLYYNTQYWDYPDGAITTFLLGAFCFTLVRTKSRFRLLVVAVGGAFAAAAAATNPFSVIFLIGIPLLYVFIHGDRLETAQALRRAGRDVSAFAVGALIFLTLCGLFAKAKGGPFLFQVTQWKAARALDSADWKFPGYDWMRSEPRLLVPVFLAVCTSALVLVRPRGGLAWRFAAGAALYLALVEAILFTWELFFGGFFLDYTYYFGYVNTAFVICLGSIVSRLAVIARPGRRAALSFVVLGTIAVFIPVLLIYRSDRADLVGRSAMWWTVVAMVVAGLVLASAILVRKAVRLKICIAALAVAVIAFAASFGYDASSATFTWGYSRDYRPTYVLGMDLIAFLRDNGYQGELPMFWYNEARMPNATGIQSLYYYGYSSIGFRLPEADAGVRDRIEAFHSRTLVMLCLARACSDADAHLRSLGYSVSFEREHRIQSGRMSVWVRVVSLGRSLKS